MKEENNGLEKFLNSQLGNEEIPFEESDWNAMEEKLDKFDLLTMNKTAGWKRIFLISSAAALLFLAGWFTHGYLGTADLPGNAVEQEGLPDFSESSDDSADSGSGTEIAQADSGTPTDRKSATTDNTTGTAQQQDNAETSGEEVMPATRLKENIPSGQGRQSALAPESADGLQSNQSTENQVLVTEATGETRANKSPADPLQIIPLDDQPVFPGDLAYIEPIVPFYIPEMPYFLLTGVEQDKEEIVPAGKTGRWALGLTMAPDLNGVGPAKNYKLAWEAGILAYYSITPHWRLSTGILYAKKSYLASGSDYNPPEGYWAYTTNGIIPEEVDAKCAVMDIPFNISYVWNPKSKFTFTATTGVSHYFILNENYKYNFGYYSPSNGYDSWSTEENSFSAFGMLNAGVGAEWRIRQGLRFSVEPYFKIPLRDIGFGNVSLNGTGIYFTIRKQFNQK